MRAAFAAGDGQLVDLTAVVEPLAHGDGSDDLDRFAGAAHGLVERDAVPAFHDLRSAGSDAEDAPSAGSARAAIARSSRASPVCRAPSSAMPEPSLIVDVQAARYASGVNASPAQNSAHHAEWTPSRSA